MKTQRRSGTSGESTKWKVQTSRGQNLFVQEFSTKKLVKKRNDSLLFITDCSTLLNYTYQSKFSCRFVHFTLLPMNVLIHNDLSFIAWQPMKQMLIFANIQAIWLNLWSKKMDNLLPFIGLNFLPFQNSVYLFEQRKLHPFPSFFYLFSLFFQISIFFYPLLLFPI